eukprot:354448-Chlamydomonas_euryale.AAC.1
MARRSGHSHRLLSRRGRSRQIHVVSRCDKLVKVSARPVRVLARSAVLCPNMCGLEALSEPTHAWCELDYARSRVTPNGNSRSATGKTGYARFGLRQVWVRTATLQPTLLI